MVKDMLVKMVAKVMVVEKVKDMVKVKRWRKIGIPNLPVGQ